jgi:hypothetical protein
MTDTPQPLSVRERLIIEWIEAHPEYAGRFAGYRFVFHKRHGVLGVGRTLDEVVDLAHRQGFWAHEEHELCYGRFPEFGDGQIVASQVEKFRVKVRISSGTEGFELETEFASASFTDALYGLVFHLRETARVIDRTHGLPHRSQRSREAEQP